MARPKDPEFSRLLELAFGQVTVRHNKTLETLQREIGDQAGCSLQTVYNWRKTGKIPEIRPIRILLAFFIEDMGLGWARELLEIVRSHNLLTQAEANGMLQSISQAPPPLPRLDEPPNDRTQEQLKNILLKLRHLSKIDEWPFALVGGVYLDEIVAPVNTRDLLPQEWTNISTISFDLGGSGIWVGRYLYQWHQIRSHLFSVRGRGNDIFTRLFSERLQEESWNTDFENREGGGVAPPRRWLYDHVPRVGEQDSHTGTTIHLVQTNEEYTTMLTRPGVLKGFNWNNINLELFELFEQGGVLYISGYLKTNLQDNLLKHLSHLSLKKVLICIDHGRIVRRYVDRGAVAALRDAFTHGRVDVYFATLSELRNFCHISDNQTLEKPINSDEVIHILQELVQHYDLPPITIVRDNKMAGRIKAFAIVGKKVFPVEGKAGQSQIYDCIGPKNAFNAAFLHAFCVEYQTNLKNKDLPWQVIEDTVVEAGRIALDKWHRTSGHEGPFAPY